MMKYIFVPHIEEVPEWKQCYYDKKTLVILIELCEKSHQLTKEIRRKIQAYEQTAHRIKKSQKELDILTRMEHLSRCQFRLRDIALMSHRKFYQFSQNQIQTIYLFAQFKTFQIKDKLERLMELSSKIEWENIEFISLIENAYIQVHYLQRMVQYNRAQQSIIVREYQLNLYQYESLYQAEPYSRKMDRMQRYIKTMAEQLQKLYMVKRCKTQSQAMTELLFFGDTSGKNDKKEMFSLGFGMGILLIVLAALIFFKEYNNITLEESKTYQADFPIWRGASYLIVYQWIMGCCLLFLQSTQINYKLILHLETQSLPKAKAILQDAQLITIVYLSFFCIYMLQVARVIETQFNYWGHILWGILLCFYLIPLPFTNYQGKIYMLKMLLKVIVSPFFKCNMFIIWITQQIVSFSQPFSDLAYTICKAKDYNSKCKDIPYVNFIILIVIFSYRITQNTRMFYQNNWNIVPPFYGIWRALGSLITVILSYKYRQHFETHYFIAYLVFAIISTCYAFFVDLKTDWGFLSQNLLRKNLFFSDSTYIYYTIIMADFLLRCNWTLNISPTFVESLGILPYYLIMIVSYLELFRRGIWNILWMENLHAKNCQKFQATIDDSHIEVSLREKYKIQSQVTADLQQQRQTRQKQQKQLVTQNIFNREQYKKGILTFIEKSSRHLMQLQGEVSRYRSA